MIQFRYNHIDNDKDNDTENENYHPKAHEKTRHHKANDEKQKTNARPDCYHWLAVNRRNG